MSSNDRRPRVAIVDPHTWAFAFHIRKGDEFWWDGSLHTALSDADLVRGADGVISAWVEVQWGVHVPGFQSLCIPVDEPVAFLDEKKVPRGH